MEYGSNTPGRSMSPIPPRVGSPLRINSSNVTTPSTYSLLNGHSVTRHVKPFRDPTISRTSTLHGPHMNSMARRWIRWLVKSGSNKAWTTISIFILALLTRWLVGLGCYSGAQLSYWSHNILTYAKGKEPLLCMETMRRSAIGWS